MRAVLRVPAFRRFLSARAVTWTGNALTLVTLPVMLYQRTGSAALTGLLTACEALPYLVLGLPAGALADRWDARRTMVGTSLASAAAMASVPVAHHAGVLTTGQLLAVAVLVASLFVVFDAASFGALPQIVGADQLAEASSAMVTASTIIGMAGPALGGLLIGPLGGHHVLALDAVGYLGSTALLLRARWPAPPREAAGRGVRRLAAEVGEGLRFLWAHDTIRPLTLLGVGNSLTGGAVGGLVVVVADRGLGLDVGDRRLGLLYAALAAGACAAGLVLPAAQRRWPTGTITLGALGACWVMTVAWAASRTWWAGAAVLVGWQVASSLVVLNGIVVRQVLTPAHLQGRVNTTARMIAWGGAPLGAAAGGVLADSWGTTAALLVASAGVGASLLLGLRSGLTRTRRLDQARAVPVP